MSDERSDATARDAAVRRLSEETVASVAAGEVITRPADVVVELLENALDAGASRVDVAVAGDGTERLRVRDDGQGMSRSDAEIAVERHTTSKLREDTELSAVETLGFRGEALPSIATAATLEVVTNDGGPRGTRVVAAGGPGADSVEAVGRGRGTTVTVRDLFGSTPARRESLAASRTEFARVSDVVSRYALIRPDVAVSLTHDDSEVFSTPGTGEFDDALLGVYDREAAARSTAIDATTTASSAEIGVRGVLVHPSTTRARQDHVYVAVDGRPVRNARLRRAVVEGYGDLLPDDRAPIAVVSVSLPTAWADHNVHPRKREVRLRDAEAVASVIASTVGDALSTADVRHAESLSTDLDASLEPLEGADSDFTDVRVLGQFRDLYVLCERGSDLLVVDQHAAHERVNYERLRAAVDGDVPSVAVDPPERVRLTPAQSAAIEPHRDALAAVGYDVDLFGETSVRVHSVPAPLGRTAAPETVRDAIDALRHGETPDDGREDLLKDLACHPSLKAGTELPDDAATELVERLGACENPYACPHGRPTVLTIDEATFVRGFGRRGTRMDR
ncbi:DNA mismatch repair endonuclease MutL [Halobellus clavatus]|uniref:DNA mismatch repair protein MutL n=1 Tax=Halobellus clavatus TaxID=660517 RepID=A0A1H3J568_9EURY|nr:DNA mismatch repair endonuclease MutL [Halobellus clavatus]SDY35052.1 DNA mismatch repair protein MutL [Halobellus clavatus]